MVTWIAHVTTIGFFTFIIWVTLGAFRLKLFQQLILCLGILLFVNTTLEHLSPLLNKISRINNATFEMPVNDPITKYFDPPNHHGIDIAVPEGTVIKAQGDGRVSVVKWDDIYGQMVIVDYDNGLQAVYAHLRDITVAEGNLVVKGRKLGTSGNTGRSSGPHLHYEIRINGIAVDPLLYIKQ